jgi:heme b synthase
MQHCNKNKNDVSVEGAESMPNHGAGLKVVAWETTRRCGLNCKHCRAEAVDSEYSGELTTDEAYKMVDSLASFAKPVLILTGGEPMIRKDIYDLASYADKQGLRVVMAPCGSLVNSETVVKMKLSGIQAISISLDGANSETHDSFRGVPGAFATAVGALEFAKEGNLPFQINTTVSKLNVDQLDDIYKLAVNLGASVLDFFFLVPTGRGAGLRDLEIDGVTYEKTLNWIYELSQNSPIGIKTTCAPHYARIQEQRAGEDYKNIPQRFRARSCMGGKGFIFISHRGIVQPCGFLNLECGNLRKMNFDLKKIYQESTIFNELRNSHLYKGACGSCKFVTSCGGCRARAYEISGDYLDEEPNCIML